MMKRLLSLLMAVSLTLGIVLTAPMAAADTYSRDEMDAALSGSVVVSVTNSFVNVRKGPGLSYEIVGSLYLGDKVTVTETKQAEGYLWGKYEQGWFVLSYTNYETVIRENASKVTVTVTGTAVNLRKGAGTGYGLAGSAKKGDRLEITETKQAGGLLWGKCDKGWIALKYTNYEDVIKNPPPEENPVQPAGVTVTVTSDSVNVRKGAGTNYTIVGTAKKGDTLVVTETKQIGNLLWGKTDKGWVSLKHTNYNDAIKEPVNPPVDDPQPPVTVEKTYGTVIKTQSLTVRSEPDGTAIGSLKLGTKVEILEQKTVAGRLWGRYEGGWICMRSYVQLETVTETVEPQPPVDDPKPPVVEPQPPVTVEKTYGTVIKTNTLTVRSEPDGTAIGSLKLGTKVEILEQKTVAGRLWGRYEGGWICMRSYVQLETVTEIVEPQPPVDDPQPPVTVEKVYATVIKTDTLTVRTEPDGTAIGKLNKGDKVEILEQKTVAGRLWGRYEGGWICMRSYVQLETVIETIEPVDPPTDPVDPPTDPVDPPTDPVDPPTDPVDPPTDPVDPPTDPVDPPTDPVDPPTDPVDPPTDPVDPPVEPDPGIEIEVKVDDVNLRESASTESAVLGKANTGDKLIVTETLEAEGLLWGKTDKGWLALKFTNYEEVNPSEPQVPAGIEVTVTNTTVNVREGAGLNYNIISELVLGDKVVITETAEADGLLWGKFDRGWVSLKHTNYEELVNPLPTPPEDDDTPVENRTSEDGLAFIKNMEGFSAKPYVDTDGHYTIGYGTWCKNEYVAYYNKYPMTKEQADRALRKSVKAFEAEVERFEKLYDVTFTQQQFDAVISLIFNCGSNSLFTGTTLINALTMEELDENYLLYAFSIYSMSGGNRSLGHVKRRLLEAKMYLYADYTGTMPDYVGYVIYEPCGGKNVSGNGTYNVQGYNTTLTAQPITAVREGYLFKGWYTQKEGGMKVEVLDRTTRNAILYAQWELDPDYTGTLPQEPEPPAPEVPKLPGNHGFVLDGNAMMIDPVAVRLTANNIAIYKGPGTTYEQLKWGRMDEKYHIFALYETNGQTWGLTASGWVKLQNTNYAYVTAEKTPVPEVPEGGKLVTTTYIVVMYDTVLKARDYPNGTPQVIYNKGDRVELLYTMTLTDDSVWGYVEGGWVNMLYAEIEYEYEVIPPEEPVDPPVDPENPTDPEEPVDPENPTDPEEPVDPENPTDPEEPVDPENPTDPEEPVDPENPTDPEEPVDPENPTDPEEPVDPENPTDPEEPVDPENPTDPEEPVDPENPTDPEEPVDPENPTDPEESTDPEEPTEPEKRIGTVTATALNIRSDAGTGNAVVGTYYKGKQVEILEQKQVGNTTWGRTDRGWISLQYVQF